MEEEVEEALTESGERESLLCLSETVYLLTWSVYFFLISSHDAVYDLHALLDLSTTPNR